MTNFKLKCTSDVPNSFLQGLRHQFIPRGTLNLEASTPALAGKYGRQGPSQSFSATQPLPEVLELQRLGLSAFIKKDVSDMFFLLHAVLHSLESTPSKAESWRADGCAVDMTGFVMVVSQHQRWDPAA